MKLLVVTQKVNQNDQLLGFFIDWLRKFAGKFDKVTVLCLEKGKFDLPENVRVISLGKDSGASKLKQLSTFYFLLSTLRNDYDAVFVHMNPIWVVLGSIPWRLLGKRIYLWYTHKAVTLKLRLAEKMADSIFTASEESFRIESDKKIVTGHGIDTQLFQSSGKFKAESGKLEILSVGRISPVKNYEVLIDAAEILKNRGIDFMITMVGEAGLESDRKYEKNLKFKIENLKLQEYFKFVGKVDHKDLPAYYQSNDLFIHLSKTGSVDKTLLEAMACGMKVLSSNDSARAFLQENLLFNESDPVNLADKIMAVKGIESSPALREYVVNNHNLNKLINKISSIVINT